MVQSYNDREVDGGPAGDRPGGDPLAVEPAEPAGGGTEPAGRALPEVGALSRAVLQAVGRGGAASAVSALDVVEGAARALVRRVVDGAVADPRPVEDRRRLAKALRRKSDVAGGVSGAAAVALSSRVARRLGPAKFLAKRGPLWLLASAGPAVYSSIARGADELGLVASHLVHRARAAGIEPDSDRLRRVAVQLLTDKPVRPDHEPSHGPLAVAWAKRAVRAALPFTAGVRTRDPDGLARAAAAVDPADVGPRPEVIDL